MRTTGWRILRPSYHIVRGAIGSPDHEIVVSELRLYNEAYLASPSLYSDPAKTFLPFASFTSRALATLSPSLARNPLTEIWSPGFSEFLVQPLCIRVFGLPNSHSQLL